mmetsp:Transcript_121878/g.272418  ORF Transcript_121878/g.272418 Transcript_121878/m.272418 type:complete len:248 (-) Transcript_121878:790-1533(-)
MSASSALESSSSSFLASVTWASAFIGSTAAAKPVRARLAGGSSSFSSGTTTPAKAAGPFCRKSSRNSSKSSMVVAPGPSRSALKRESLSMCTFVSVQVLSATIRPRAAVSFNKVTKASRRLRSSRRAVGSGFTLACASAPYSAACLRSRSEAHTRKASRGGSSSWSSSRRARTAAASFQRKRVRLSSGSDAMRRCKRTTRSARRSARAFRCFSSSRSMTVLKTSSRRKSDLTRPQASSPARRRAASS